MVLVVWGAGQSGPAVWGSVQSVEVVQMPYSRCWWCEGSLQLVLEVRGAVELVLADQGPVQSVRVAWGAVTFGPEDVMG